MSMFHVGQKVVCIWTFQKRSHEIDPVKGVIYTVRDSFIDEDGKPVIRLEEIINPILQYLYGMDEARFNATGFRPVHTTNIAIFEAMLVPPPKEKVEA